MRPRSSILLALALFASGCTSTNKILTKDPDEVFRTGKSPAEVAACFERRNNIRVIERTDGARVARFRNGYGGVVKTFSIYPEGTGSRIETRHSFIVVPFIKWKQCIGLEPEG